jgi:hypothetical protein
MYSMNINKQIALRYFLQQQKIKSCYPYHMLIDVLPIFSVFTIKLICSYLLVFVCVCVCINCFDLLVHVKTGS